MVTQQDKNRVQLIDHFANILKVKISFFFIEISWKFQNIENFI